MVQVCPRCQRANPREAVFCYFDGIVLNQGAPAARSAGLLLHEFVFPSGRRCRTFDDLVQGCQYEWEDARGLLRGGAFARFLGSVGRHDLVRAAQEALAQSDPDIALYTFVQSLPATAVQGPRLDLNPRRLTLGPVRVGEQRQLRLTVTNQGKGLLQGKLTVAEGGQWLRVEGPAGGPDGQVPLKAPREQQVTLRVDTRGLTAPQTYSARLVAITNGGIAEVPIRLDLATLPFARAPYQGANSPHDMARRMRDNPKPAVALLESGDVARWFAANGWSYPVAGPPARGVAAVQQFFEGLGLSKPPPLQLSEQEFHFRCTPPEVMKAQVTLRTTARKLVYAQADSDAPWLRVTTPSVSGAQQVTVEFEVDGSLVDEARPYLGTVRLVANAGQAFAVRVRVDVSAPARTGWFRSARAPTSPPTPPPTPAPVPAVPVAAARAPAPGPAEPRPAWRSSPANTFPAPGPPPARAPEAIRPPPAPAPAPPWLAEPVTLERAARPAGGVLQAFVAAAVTAFLLRLLLAGPADLYARVLASSARHPAPGTLERWRLSPVAEDDFLRSFVLATWWVGVVVGVALVWRRGGGVTDLACGVIAGAGAGVGGSATAGCLLILLDSLPRGVLAALPPHAVGSVWLATALWLALATLCWSALGGVLGFVLYALVPGGARLVSGFTSPLAGLFRACGLERLARFFRLDA